MGNEPKTASDMKMNVNPDWLLQMAEKEGNGILSVGGLVTDVKANDAHGTLMAAAPDLRDALQKMVDEATLNSDGEGCLLCRQWSDGRPAFRVSLNNGRHFPNCPVPVAVAALEKAKG